MSKNDIIYIILIAIVALGIAVFQYFYKAKRTDNKRFIFAFLRFSSLFLLGLLLLNPTFKQSVLTDVKPNLVVAIDNSNSISQLKQNIKVSGFLKELKKSELSDKFQIAYYSFGKEVSVLSDSLDFIAPQTNISKVFTTLKEVYSETQSPTILLTDGNQTYGQDYVLSSLSYKQSIYPVVLGDSILKTDLKISNLQHNKYAFLNNELPIEITLKYIGSEGVNKQLVVYSGKSKVYVKSISFSKEANTQVVSFHIPAKSVGKYKLKAVIEQLNSEENTINNIRNFSVEVIDEQTNVLIVSDIVHPDIGALKKAIETNKQRKVTIVNSRANIDYNKYQLLIIYQPTAKFKQVFSKIDIYKKNYLTVTGLQTDWAFLNTVSKNYKNYVINKSQEYLGDYNDNFDLFQNDKLDIESYPPLLGFYGDIQLKNTNSVLLYQSINSIITNSPLLSFFENNNNRREAVLFGEGVWKWRAQSYINTQNFEKFDALVGKMIQYLASNTRKERLVIDVADELLPSETKINAQYFDKNYVLDANETIKCNLVNKETKQEYSFNFLYKSNGYELDLTHLLYGNYEYKISVVDKGLMKKGAFEILNFNIEKQFINPDVTKLHQLATNGKTSLYYIANYKKLFSELKHDKLYQTIQRVTITRLPLIDWKYLLGILLLLLTFEWFLRKYNGLI